MRKSDRGTIDRRAEFARPPLRERVRDASASASFSSSLSHPVIHLDGSQTRGQAQLHPRQKAARADRPPPLPRTTCVVRARSTRRGEPKRDETARDEAQVLCRGQRRREQAAWTLSARVLCQSSAAPRSLEGSLCRPQCASSDAV